MVAGTFQPSNELKLTFYGLYKQATVGPCNEPRPSIFNYINRAKWYFSKIEIFLFFLWRINPGFRDAWDKCRPMSKQAAMVAYIDEIRKVGMNKSWDLVNREFRFLKQCRKQMKYWDLHNWLDLSTNLLMINRKNKLHQSKYILIERKPIVTIFSSMEPVEVCVYSKSLFKFKFNL